MGHTENIKLLGIFGIIDYDQLKKNAFWHKVNQSNLMVTIARTGKMTIKFNRCIILTGTKPIAKNRTQSHVIQYLWLFYID